MYLLFQSAVSQLFISFSLTKYNIINEKNHLLVKYYILRSYILKMNTNLEKMIEVGNINLIMETYVPNTTEIENCVNEKIVILLFSVSHDVSDKNML